MLFPLGRDFIGELISGMGQRLDKRLTRWQQPRNDAPPERWREARRWGARRLKFVRRHALPSAAAAALVPSLLALFLSNPGMLPGYEPSAATPDARDYRSPAPLAGIRPKKLNYPSIDAAQ